MTILTFFILSVAVVLSLLEIPIIVKVVAISIAAGVVVLGFFQSLPRIKTLSKVKQRYWVVMALFTLLLTVNILARVYEQVWDVSRLRLYSLRQESIEWIGKLKNSVTVHIFLRSDDKTSTYVNWLRDSAQSLGEHLSIQVHNINRDVTLADKYGVNKVGEVVLESGSRWVKVSDFKEATLVTGLARLFNRENTSVCFTTDHGEPDITDESPAGISYAAEALQGLGYSTKAINLQTADNLADTCSLIVVMGAKSDFFPVEIAALESLSEKVPLLFAVGPDAPPSIAVYLQERGLGLTKELLLDQGNLSQRIPLTDILVNLSASDNAGTSLKGNLFLPRVQSLRIVDSGKGWVPILMTSTQQEVQDESGDSGPFVLAATQRIANIPAALVIGSARPFINTNWRYASNAVYFAQSVRSLLNELDISLPEYGLVTEPLMAMTEVQAVWIKSAVVYVLPGIVLLLCGVIWAVHRRASA